MSYWSEDPEQDAQYALLITLLALCIIVVISFAR